MSVCLSVLSVFSVSLPLFDFCFVCHHFAAAWASSLAHYSLGGKREVSLAGCHPDSRSVCLNFPVSVRMCLSVCLSCQDGAGVWLTLWVVTVSRQQQQLWGVSPAASRACRGGTATGGTAPSLRLVSPGCYDYCCYS